MPTFQELQSRLKVAKDRKAILIYLLEHIDSTFLPVAGAVPSRLLLTDDKLPVPVEAFETLQSDTLSAEVQQLDQEIANILAGTVTGATVPVVPSGTTSVTEVPPRRRGRPRRAQGERA